MFLGSEISLSAAAFPSQPYTKDRIILQSHNIFNNIILIIILDEPYLENDYKQYYYMVRDHVNRKTNCSIPPFILTLVIWLLHAELRFSGTNLEFQEEDGEEPKTRHGV